MRTLADTGAGPGRAQRAAGDVRDHALFKQHPLAGQARLSSGIVSTPYHVYAGHGVFIGGTADLAATRELLAPEQVQAVQTDEGRALMGVWVFDFSDASLGAHHELQMSIFVSRGTLAPVRAHRLNLIELMLTRPDVHMLCHGLWNSTPNAVAYNRELLALNARLSRSRIEHEPGALRFAVHDEATGAPVLQGSVRRPRRPSLRANLALVAHLGVMRLIDVARQPWMRVPVLNPVGDALQRNAAADSFTKADLSVLRYFDTRRDSLVFGDTRYQQLGFVPQFFQYMEGFKFVYLFPV